MRVDVCWSVAHGFGMTNATAGTAFHTLGTRLSLNLGDPFRAARALSGYALTASLAGRKGRRYTAEVIGLIRALNAKLRDPYIEAFSHAADGFASYMLEDWTTASGHFSEAIVGFRDRCVGAAYELATVRNMLGRALANRGRLGELEAQVAPTLRDAIRRNDLFNVVNVRTTAGAILALAHDDIDGAASEIDEAEAALSPSGFQVQHVYWLIAAGMRDLYRGVPEEGLARLATHQAALKRSLLESVPSVRVMTTHLRARLHLALALRDKAHRDEHMEVASRCAHRLRSEQLPASEAFASLIEGTLLLLRGSRDEGIRDLRHAVGLFDKSDMSLCAAAGRDVLGRLVGGDEGRALVEAAHACFAREGIVSIERFVGLYAPGVPVAAQS
jgi:hypothetical protein